MKKLIEIAKIVTKKKVIKLEVLDEYVLKKQSKINEFFEGITGNKFKNDRDAALLLYNSTPQDPKYRKLKSRFRQRLLNTIFLIEPNQPATGDYDRAYFNCQKEWAQIKILMSNDATLIAESLTKHLFNTSKKFKFTEIILNCIRDLKAHAVRKMDQKEFNNLVSLEKIYTELFEHENKALELSQKAKLLSGNQQRISDQLLLELDEICQQLLELSQKFDSPVIYRELFNAWITRYEMEADFNSVVEVCIQAEQYLLNNKKFFPKKAKYFYYVKKITAFLHLQDYSRGKKHTESCITDLPTDAREWLDFMEIYLLLAIHSRNYIQAFAIFNNIISNNYFKRIDSEEKEKWKLLNAYMYYILEIKNLDRILIKQVKQNNFKLETYLDQNTKFPKHLRTIEILKKILQALFFIQQRKFNKAGDTINKLNYDANHRLGKESFFRSIQFIKLLSILKKADFNVEGLRLSEKYYSRLVERPFYYRSFQNGLEIIPYETLWEMILDDLE